MKLNFAINIIMYLFHVSFLSCHLKVKVAELLQSGIEDHTFGPTNAKEHFPEDELTLGKTGC